MVSPQQFSQLSYVEKKQILIDIFYDLKWSPESPMSTIVDMLAISNEIAEKTLDEAFGQISDLLAKRGSMSRESYDKKLKAIHKKLQGESEKSSSEAEAMLLDLDI